MSYYTIETWTIRTVAKAFNFKESATDDTDLRVVVPIFQRGLRWSPQKRRNFIDSLEKGYPFGSLLFAKQEGINKYSVVDGLQRGSTVCDFVYNPLGRDNITSIDNDVLIAIRDIIYPNSASISICKEIEKKILDYFHEQKRFDNVQILTLTRILINEFQCDQDRFTLAIKIQDAIQPFFDKKKEKYNAICDSPVPIVVYSGPQDLLNTIFNRINTSGIPLSDYDIYSATWSQKKYIINAIDVVEAVINKYWILSDAGYEIDGFDATDMRTSKELTAFEFLFGLGKTWIGKYDILKIKSSGKADEIDEISFEIVDACINDSKSISTLDKRLQSINVNKLQRRIQEAIEFVQNSIATVSSFKGNTRKFKVLHSKYQIVSMIAYAFREMYSLDNLDIKKYSWNNERQQKLSNLLLNHYVADIIENEWHDGGGAKVYNVLNEKKYDEEITKKRWDLLLDNYYQSQLQNNKQRERFSNPVNSDSVILNCIYVNLFSAADHLSSQKFDIEHIATKERMKSILKNIPELKLPIACIANLCYLPEDINRGKKEKTIYEATDLSLSIYDIENKYSFTKEEDMMWISRVYGEYDKNQLIENYQRFLDKRYLIMKNKFLDFFDQI